jgi:hypothetical protein
MKISTPLRWKKDVPATPDAIAAILAELPDMDERDLVLRGVRFPCARLFCEDNPSRACGCWPTSSLR